MGDFNAKLFNRFPGEEDVLGERILQSPQRRHLPLTNRELLIETCRGLRALVANTFFELDDEHLITCYVVGAKPMNAITPQHFLRLMINACLA